MAITNPQHVRTHGGEWYFTFDTPTGPLREKWKVGAGGGTAAEWLTARAIALQADLERRELDRVVQRVEDEGRTGLWLAQNPDHLTTGAGGINHAIAAKLIRWMMKLGKSSRPADNWQAIFALAMIEDLIEHIEAQGWTAAQIANVLNITTGQLSAMNQRIDKLRNIDTLQSPLDAARNYLLDAEDWE